MFPRISKAKRKSGTYEYLVISESVRVKGERINDQEHCEFGQHKTIQ